MACWNNHPAGNLFCQSEVFHHSDGASFPLSPKLFIHFGHHDLLQVLNFANISLSELLRIISIHQTFWGRLTLTQTVFAPLSGNRAIFNVCLPDAPQVCGRGEKTPIEISYNRKSPTCFHWERELKVLQLSVIWQQSECFRAEVGVPRRGRFGEFPFRNISYVRKADNRLDCKVFAARPKKKKKKISVPLSCLELWPKEAWEPAIRKHWLLADYSSGWFRMQTVKYAHTGAKCKVQAPWGAGERLWQVSGWCPHWHISFINNWV